jgi:hypothetical protein
MVKKIEKEQAMAFHYTATLPAYCHTVAYISYTCHIDMANGSIRRHLREAEL